jgi:hypothetical protein
MAETYSPPQGARAAARKAIKFKEDGKANGAGTSVGWTRAGQLARGEALSLDTVKRMYSYFSRHEVDKKGKDWANQSNPSNGYIMWLAWGGDAGYSWSRSIVQRETDKGLFADFGADRSSHQQLSDISVEKDVAPANPSFTVDPKYPGVGIKRQQQGNRPTGGNIKSKYGKKPKGIRGGRSGDATGSDGAFSSGGPGGSLG